MRKLVAVLILASACGNPASPSTTVAGSWSENFSIPGASLILTIDVSGNGSGTYAIEAGRSGSVQVNGTVVQPMVTLTIQYDSGTTRVFRGTLSDSNHLTGAFDDTSGTVVFTRR